MVTDREDLNQCVTSQPAVFILCLEACDCAEDHNLIYLMYVYFSFNKNTFLNSDNKAIPGVKELWCTRLSWVRGMFASLHQRAQSL